MRVSRQILFGDKEDASEREEQVMRYILNWTMPHAGVTGETEEPCFQEFETMEALLDEAKDIQERCPQSRPFRIYELRTQLNLK